MMSPEKQNSGHWDQLLSELDDAPISSFDNDEPKAAEKAPQAVNKEVVKEQKTKEVKKTTRKKATKKTAKKVARKVATPVIEIPHISKDETLDLSVAKGKPAPVKKPRSRKKKESADLPFEQNPVLIEKMKEADAIRSTLIAQIDEIAQHKPAESSIKEKSSSAEKKTEAHLDEPLPEEGSAPSSRKTKNDKPCRGQKSRRNKPSQTESPRSESRSKESVSEDDFFSGFEMETLEISWGRPPRSAQQQTLLETAPAEESHSQKQKTAPRAQDLPQQTPVEKEAPKKESAMNLDDDWDLPNEPEISFAPRKKKNIEENPPRREERVDRKNPPRREERDDRESAPRREERGDWKNPPRREERNDRRNAPRREERGDWENAPRRDERNDRRNTPRREERNDHRNTPRHEERGDWENVPRREERNDRRNAPRREERGDWENAPRREERNDRAPQRYEDRPAPKAKQRMNDYPERNHPFPEENREEVQPRERRGYDNPRNRQGNFGDARFEDRRENRPPRNREERFENPPSRAPRPERRIAQPNEEEPEVDRSQSSQELFPSWNDAIEQVVRFNKSRHHQHPRR